MAWAGVPDLAILTFVSSASIMGEEEGGEG